MVDSPAPSPEPWDARPGSKLRAVLVFLPAVLWGFGYAAFRVLHAVLMPNSFRRNQIRHIRTWGKVMLPLFGIEVEVHGLEHRDREGAKIVMFNHVNLVDLMVLSAYYPDNAIVLYKKEFRKVPFIGRAFRVLNMIEVDRQNRAAGHASIAEAARRVRETGESVLIAPEGTRSGTGELGPFKMGPFHLAAASKAPVVPMITRGLVELLAPGDLLIRPGRVHLEFLPPIDTKNWSEGDVHVRANEVRETFLRHLGGAPAREKP